MRKTCSYIFSSAVLLMLSSASVSSEYAGEAVSGVLCSILNTPGTSGARWSINLHDFDNETNEVVFAVSKNRKIQSVACRSATEPMLFSMRETQTGDYELYNYDPVSEEPLTQLTDNDTDDVDVTMSADGKVFAYQARLADGRQSITLNQADEGGQYTTRSLASASPFVQPMLSANGKWLVFVQLRPSYFALMRYDITENTYTEIRKVPRRKKLYHPSISNDGNIIGWTENQSQKRYLVKNLEDGSVTEVLNEADGVEHGTLSTDGKMLTYSVNGEQSSQIFMLNLATLEISPVEETLASPNRYLGVAWRGGISESTVGSSGSVVISEFMASNETTLATADGEYADWIELNNTGDTPVDLTGWCLTDDVSDLTQWCFESGTLEAGGYLVVFASGDDVKTGSELHTNFKLGKDGEYLGLINANGEVAYEYADSYPVQTDDVSYGISVSGDLAYFETATSGGTNGEGSAESPDVVADADFEATDWTEETHSKNVDPNFDEVFSDIEVKRLDFVITAERWQSMLDDMTAKYGVFGAKSTGGPGGGGPGGQDTTLLETDEDPIFVPADVSYNSKQWYRVGVRFKGNSSLQGAWQSGVYKMSFKMDFDEYEDDYPQIKNQRFYGFKKFSLKNNYNDDSMLREKVAADVFKAAGVPVPNTSFYTLYVDHGNGPQYFGLYTLVEEIDDTVIDTQFASNDGNLYKPEDGSANFVEGTFNADDFEKKTNEDDADWSDIESLFAALHSGTRTSDPATWRANLESVFDVQGFLKYLAVNGIIQNWDTYGRMTHNYYLYNNPETGKLTWIPWDNNESLQEGKQGGALDLDFSNLSGSEWPLIAKIYADSQYKADYGEYLREVIDGAFETTAMQAKYDAYQALVESDATTEERGYTFLSSDRDFYNEVTTLKSHASTRATMVESYLNSQ